MTKRRGRAPRTTSARKAFFVVLTFVSAVSLVAAAQTKKSAPKTPATAPAKKAPSKAPAESLDASAPAKEAPKEATETKAEARERESAKANGSEQKSPDGGSRVFRFGEVEVEGRLKSPQIVYFLRRVRAEFAATDLGHRSFMTELGETKYEPSF